MNAVGRLYEGCFSVSSRILQRFACCADPLEAERILRPLMEMWQDKAHFKSAEHRRKSSARRVNLHKWVKPQKSFGNLTSGKELCLSLFSQDFVNNA